MIVNLHGLGSVGENTAYKYLSKVFEHELIYSPTYTVYNFEQGMRDIEQQLDFDKSETLVFVGSSTGALFAEALSEKYNGQAVLINPVSDINQIKGRIGRNKNHYTGESYVISQSDLDTFPVPIVNETLDIPRAVFYEKDDDVLDHKLTEYKYRNNGVLYPFDGDSHRFTHWEEIMPIIKNFYNRIYG